MAEVFGCLGREPGGVAKLSQLFFFFVCRSVNKVDPIFYKSRGERGLRSVCFLGGRDELQSLWCCWCGCPSVCSFRFLSSMCKARCFLFEGAESLLNVWGVQRCHVRESNQDRCKSLTLTQTLTSKWHMLCRFRALSTILQFYNLTWLKGFLR